MVIELCIVQFRFEIILWLSNELALRAHSLLRTMRIISDYWLKLHSTKFIYRYLSAPNWHYYVSKLVKHSSNLTTFSLGKNDWLKWKIRNICSLLQASYSNSLTFIRGPSITFNGLGYNSLLWRASSVSSTTNLSIPCWKGL